MRWMCGRRPRLRLECHPESVRSRVCVRRCPLAGRRRRMCSALSAVGWAAAGRQVRRTARRRAAASLRPGLRMCSALSAGGWPPAGRQVRRTARRRAAASLRPGLQSGRTSYVSGAVRWRVADGRPSGPKDRAAPRSGVSQARTSVRADGSRAVGAPEGRLAPRSGVSQARTSYVFSAVRCRVGGGRPSGPKDRAAPRSGVSQARTSVRADGSRAVGAPARALAVPLAVAISLRERDARNDMKRTARPLGRTSTCPHGRLLAP